MSRAGFVFLGFAVVLLAVTTLASRRGYGIPQPVKEPVSIREGSARTSAGSSHSRRSRYFVGGGIHHGK